MCPLRPEQHGECSWSSVCARDICWRKQTNGKSLWSVNHKTFLRHLDIKYIFWLHLWSPSSPPASPKTLKTFIPKTTCATKYISRQTVTYYSGNDIAVTIIIFPNILCSPCIVYLQYSLYAMNKIHLILKM